MQRFTPRGLILISVLAVAVAAVTVVAIVPSTRRAVRDFVSPPQRHILAKTSAAISVQGPFISVFKVEENDGIALEIYSSIAPGEQPQFMQKIPLNESRDGYFNFMENATNLALSDTDHDGVMEILAPTFDDSMTARLHVFRYNPDVALFEKVTPPNE